jgi:adenylate kinase family enzyme
MKHEESHYYRVRRSGEIDSRTQAWGSSWNKSLSFGFIVLEARLEMTDKDEWAAILTEIIKEDTWIMDGNFGSTMELRARAADSIVFLDYPTLRCLYGIFKRRIQFHGKSRPDMTEGCPEKLDWEFIKWVASYKRKKTPAILKMLKQYQSQGKEIYHLKSPRETKEFLANISKI